MDVSPFPPGVGKKAPVENSEEPKDHAPGKGAIQTFIPTQEKPPESPRVWAHEASCRRFDRS